MRLITFLLMMVVAIGGTLGGYRLATGRDLINLSEYGLAPQPAVSIGAAPQKAPTVQVVPPTAVPSPTATRPTPTPIPELPEKMLVGNTGGEGVFLRKTPHIELGDAHELRLNSQQVLCGDVSLASIGGSNFEPLQTVGILRLAEDLHG
ncbi:MAG TPA: hypothetical protein VHS06_07290, partial [Chloroflexota bacterium]|nr:hypothetical protein [Chloroflexota bacterium]